MAVDISSLANIAVRILLKELGAEYDKDRGLAPFGASSKDFSTVKEFFGGKCCYCNAAPGTVKDHLIPMNKESGGLHAWGNVVPACHDCNSKKHGGDWKDFIIERAGNQAHERHARMKEFLAQYGYKPKEDLREVANALYEEVGRVSRALIDVKKHRLEPKL